MPKRSSKKKPTDINIIAAQIVEAATESTAKEKPAKKKKHEKNPAAVTLGRLGGLKGGKARAAKLTTKRRKEIAQKAAKTRWGKP